MQTATITPSEVHEPLEEVDRLGSPARQWPRDAVPLAVLCLFAAVLVAYELARRSLWLDESASLTIASQHGAALWSAIAHDGGNMLAYYLLLHVVVGVFGEGLAVVRMPSVIAAVATVAIVWTIGRRLFDARTALVAGLLTLISLPFVFWGQSARGYGLLITCVAGSFLAFARLTCPDRPASRGAWIAYVASTVLALYIGFTAALIVPAQLLSLVGQRRRVRGALWAIAVIAACSVPLVVLAAQRGSGQLYWVARPSWHAVQQMLHWLTSAGLPPNFHPTALGTALLAVSLVLIVGLLAAAVRGERSWPLLLVVCWLVVPLVLSILESAVGQPILLFRNSVVSLPAVSLLLAWGLMHRRTPRWLGLSALGALLALRALVLAPTYGVSFENWQGAARYVLAASQRGDCIAFYPYDGRMAFDYYVRGGGGGRAPTPVLPSAPWSRMVPYVERYETPSGGSLERIVARCPRMWLLASHQGLPNGSPGARADYVRYVDLRNSLRLTYFEKRAASFGWASHVDVELLARVG